MLLTSGSPCLVYLSFGLGGEDIDGDVDNLIIQAFADINGQESIGAFGLVLGPPFSNTVLGETSFLIQVSMLEVGVGGGLLNGIPAFIEVAICDQTGLCSGFFGFPVVQ